MWFFIYLFIQFWLRFFLLPSSSYPALCPLLSRVLFIYRFCFPFYTKFSPFILFPFYLSSLPTPLSFTLFIIIYAFSLKYLCYIFFSFFISLPLGQSFDSFFSLHFSLFFSTLLFYFLSSHFPLPIRFCLYFIFMWFLS